MQTFTENIINLDANDYANDLLKNNRLYKIDELKNAYLARLDRRFI